MTEFDSILVANRGEIAVRVIRSAKALGYRTIAVYSEADAQALHVQQADEAYCIGAAAVADSYLNAERVLAAVKASGAQAVHPGYGFLSENADFARACEAQGVVFVGPSAEAIDSMGNKAEAKRRMLDANVPCVPGYQEADQSDEALLAAGHSIGVPLMVKAAAGGGGRGMRLVDELDALPGALQAARSEALNAFGSDELILEKAVIQPRHVEVQVFGDRQGNVIHLGERDCSVQRRHQKVIEEAPCPVMSETLRAQMGEAAVNAARAIDYVGAGTVEFLLDASGEFYFLEMNTRLQVEHPVTEMITGLDLVALQLKVAQGESLPLLQEDVNLRGHAIEVRLYAEDSSNDFLPATGEAVLWRIPEGEGVRVDHSLQSGQMISPFYDPMVAKIICWGEDRHTARRRLLRALEQTLLFGVENNRQFLLSALANPVFAKGEATTAFIAEQFDADALSRPQPDLQVQALAACLLQQQAVSIQQQAQPVYMAPQTGLRGSRALSTSYCFDPDSANLVVVQQLGECGFSVTAAEQALSVQWLSIAENDARVLIDGEQHSLFFVFLGEGEVALQWRGSSYVLSNTLAKTGADDEAAGSGQVTAPMHGNVMALLVETGDTVTAGQEVAVMEAMKMEHRLCAEVDGTVTTVHVSINQQVAANTVLLDIE